MAQSTSFMQERLDASEQERKVLHNQVVDLRGAVRVMCRARPPLLTEQNAGWQVATHCEPSASSIDVYSARCAICQPLDSYILSAHFDFSNEHMQALVCKVQAQTCHGDSRISSRCIFCRVGGNVGGSDATKEPRKNTFTFDRVWGPEASQQDVFGELKPVLRSCLDGYNVCIFAYGQVCPPAFTRLLALRCGSSVPASIWAACVWCKCSKQ